MLGGFKEILQTDFPDISEYKLFVACSGGRDSIALSSLLKECGLTHTLLHCNFKLRGAESDEDEDFVKNFASKNKIQIEVKSFDTSQVMKETGDNLQLTARNLRYDWFRTFDSRQNVLILTAHHLDDSIETLFINILRGTGIKGLTGIPKISLPYYRPLLNFSSFEIQNYVNKNQIAYREDSSNTNVNYLRNRLRHEIIPQLEEAFPNFKSKIPAFFHELDETRGFIQEHADLFMNENLVSSKGDMCINLLKLKQQESMVVQFALSDYGIKRSNLSAFLAFIESSVGATFNTATHSFKLDRDDLFISQANSSTLQFAHIVETLPTVLSISNFTVRLSSVPVDNFVPKENPFQACSSKVQFPLTLRNWRTGDKLVPLGMSGSKLLSDILIDKKIPQIHKEKIVVVTDANDNIIGIPSLVVGENYKVDENTKELIQIQISSA